MLQAGYLSCLGGCSQRGQSEGRGEVGAVREARVREEGRWVQSEWGRGGQSEGGGEGGCS